MENIIKKAKEYAIREHVSTNHKYDNHCYSKHLEDVFYVGLKFIHIMPLKEHENLLSALWLHDTIEDCRVTYNDLTKYFNITIADLVYAVSNEKGKTIRKSFFYKR
jgi:(p)ppGpp synthase/HD superfamily hydrolase